MSWLAVDHEQAPEVLVESRYSQKADVYSFGITMWQVRTGRNVGSVGVRVQ